MRMVLPFESIDLHKDCVFVVVRLGQRRCVVHLAQLVSGGTKL